MERKKVTVAKCLNCKDSFAAQNGLCFACISPRQCFGCGSYLSDYPEDFCERCINAQKREFKISGFDLAQEVRLQQDLVRFQRERKSEYKLKIKMDPNNQEYLLCNKIQKRKKNSLVNVQEAYHQGRKSLIILEQSWLDIFHKGLVNSCVVCNDPCRHLTGEDNEFLLFWKMRLVSKQWKETIDSWFKQKKFILVVGRYKYDYTRCANSQYLINKYHKYSGDIPYTIWKKIPSGNMLVSHYNRDGVLWCNCTSNRWSRFVDRVCEKHNFITQIQFY